MWTKALKLLNRIVENITAFMLATMVVLVFVQIVSREIIGSSFSWTEELSRYLMIWITFLGASFAFQYGAHIGIEFIKTRLPSFFEKMFTLLSFICCSFFFYLMVVYGFDIVGRQMGQTSPGLNIPMGYVYLVIPISAILMFINLLDVTIKSLKGERLYG